MDDVEAPARTEDAFRLLDDACSYHQMAAECEGTVAAASFRDKAERLEGTAAGFFELTEKPTIGTGRELAIPKEEMADLWGLKETLDHPGRETVAASRARLGLLVEVDVVGGHRARRRQASQLRAARRRHRPMLGGQRSGPAGRRHHDK
jgi:hypothetical protein